MAAIRTLVVAATTLEGDLLRLGLTAQPGLDVVETVESLDTVLDRARSCDVIVLHADFPPHDIVEIVRLIRAEIPEVRVVISRAPDLPQEIVPYLEAGATGYVRVGESLAQLVRVIRTVHDGAALVDPEVARHLIEHFTFISQQLASGSGTMQAPSLLDHGLTERQTDVLTLIARGMSNQEIANELYIELGTVKNHVHNILKTLDVADREQAADWFQHRAAMSSTAHRLEDPDVAEGSVDVDSPLLEGLLAALEDLSRRFGWPVGHVWVLDPDAQVMKPARIWTVDDHELRHPFVTATERREFAPQQGIIGQVHATREPLWSASITDNQGFLRAEAANEAGLRSGLFIPLIADDQLVGVMEFFSADSNIPEPDAVIEGATDMSWRLLELKRDPNTSMR
jgi:DNA-binding NarL/FixJ family response regulator